MFEVAAGAADVFVCSITLTPVLPLSARIIFSEIDGMKIKNTGRQFVVLICFVDVLASRLK